MYNNNIFYVLDIETSSIYDNNDISKPCAVWLSYGAIIEYSPFSDYRKPYIFREWEHLRLILNEISCKYSNEKVICYSHNLAYEYDFLMKNVSKSSKILANKSHGIISGELEDYPNIEFRCSYQLTNYSLKRLGEIINLPKLESEYRKILPCDSVTDEEIEYNLRDCDIVAEYLKEVFLPEFKTISNIPLTSTGLVRYTFKEFYNKTEKCCDWDLMPPEDCYNAMVGAFMGGITTSNPIYTNINLENVHSYDEESAYPYAMLGEKYGQKIKKREFRGDFNEMWIAKITFTNIRSLFDWGWLSLSKELSGTSDVISFNGKMIWGKQVSFFITSVDFASLNMTYEYEKYEVDEYYEISNIDYLPAPYIETMIKYGGEKFKLKNEKKKHPTPQIERDYMIAKGRYNSIYGMSVQKLVNEEYYIDDDFIWRTKPSKYVQKKRHLRRNFLFGIFITAYARRNLLRAIVTNCPDSFVYCDTDSIKFLGENNFKNTNPQLREEMLVYPQFKTLGKFDYEGKYDEFKTFGAKKYCYKKAGEYELVVAGLPKINKETGEKFEVNSLDDFHLNRIFPKCKLAKKYITADSLYDYDEEKEMIINKEKNIYHQWYIDNDIDTNGGVLLYPVDYKLDMTTQDLSYIKMLRGD